MVRSASDSAPVRTGAVAGVGAFVAGLSLTFIVGSLGLNASLSRLVGTVPIQGTVMAFVSLHLWPVALGIPVGGLVVWAVIPAAVLVVAGYVTAASSATRLSRGLKNGASVTVGYLAVTVLAFLVVVVLGVGEAASVGGQLGTLLFGVVVTGVFFPVVFGGLGGAIADGL